MKPRRPYVAACLALAGLFAGGCALTATVAPKPVAAKEITWSGNEQNAGVLGQLPSGVWVNEDFHDRYNLAISIYGTKTPIPLRKDQGISPFGDGATYLLANQYFPYWALMNAWRRRDGPKP